MNLLTKKSIKEFELIFFDFDGVIKKSNEVKTEAFKKIFNKFGKDIVSKVVSHHLENLGVSRVKKISYYYSQFLKQPLNQNELNSLSNDFSKLVVDSVISSEYVQGSKEYLIENKYGQEFILITGTPHDEIQFILKKLKIYDVFSKIFGSPNEKKAVVKQMLNERGNIKHKTFLVGDSRTDCDAAKSNNIPFVYRIDSYDDSKLMRESDYYLKNFSNLI